MRHSENRSKQARRQREHRFCKIGELQTESGVSQIEVRESPCDHQAPAAANGANFATIISDVQLRR
jgi:hypothetical protein